MTGRKVTHILKSTCVIASPNSTSFLFHMSGLLDRSHRLMGGSGCVRCVLIGVRVHLRMSIQPTTDSDIRMGGSIVKSDGGDVVLDIRYNPERRGYRC